MTENIPSLFYKGRQEYIPIIQPDIVRIFDGCYQHIDELLFDLKLVEQKDNTIFGGKIKKIELMRTVMCYIFVGILSLLSLSGYAQNFRILDTSNGLPNNTVKCIAQDKQGFMWFGTFDGLCRFDGVNFTVFRHDTNKSFFVARNHITCILPVDNGIWVGTEYGLFFFSFDNHKFYNCSVDDSSNGKQDILGYIQNIFVMNSSIYVLSNELMVLTENYHFNKCVFKPQSLWMQATSYKDRYIIAQNFNGIFYSILPTEILSVTSVKKFPYAADVISYDEDNDFIYIGYGLGKSTQVLRIKNDRFELQPFEALPM